MLAFLWVHSFFPCQCDYQNDAMTCYFVEKGCCTLTSVLASPDGPQASSGSSARMLPLWKVSV